MKRINLSFIEFLSNISVTDWVSLSKNIPNYAPFSFWKYEDMNLINLATGDALTRIDDGLILKPKNASDYMDPSQQWILDYNSRTCI